MRPDLFSILSWGTSDRNGWCSAQGIVYNKERTMKTKSGHYSSTGDHWVLTAGQWVTFDNGSAGMLLNCQDSRLTSGVFLGVTLAIPPFAKKGKISSDSLDVRKIPWAQVTLIASQLPMQYRKDADHVIMAHRVYQEAGLRSLAMLEEYLKENSARKQGLACKVAKAFSTEQLQPIRDKTMREDTAALHSETITAQANWSMDPVRKLCMEKPLLDRIEVVKTLPPRTQHSKPQQSNVGSRRSPRLNEQGEDEQHARFGSPPLCRVNRILLRHSPRPDATKSRYAKQVQTYKGSQVHTCNHCGSSFLCTYEQMQDHFRPCKKKQEDTKLMNKLHQEAVGTRYRRAKD